MSSSKAQAIFEHLVDVFNELQSPDITRNLILNTRAQLGYLLYRCSLIDAEKTFMYIGSVMEKVEPNTNTSLIFVAAISFVLQFIPEKERLNHIKCYYGELLHHAAFNNEEHLSLFTKYLKSGGINFVPCCDGILNELFQYAQTSSSKLARPIALILNTNPKLYSPIFWHYISLLDVNGILSYLSEIVTTTDLLPPEDGMCPHVLENIIKTAKENADPSKPFHIIEIALITLRWLVKNRCITPESVRIDYNNQSINLVAIDIWAEYASFGDLSLMPSFPPTDSRQILKSYARVIANASKNPDFSIFSFYVPHWFYDCILQEFKPGFEPKSLPPPSKSESDMNELNYERLIRESKMHKSLLSLSSEELKLFSELSDYLPAWIFVHCLRSRIKNADIQMRLLHIVSFIPKSILDTYFQDFIDFIEWCLRFPQIIDNLIHTIESLCGFLLGKIPKIIDTIVQNIDYFHEEDLSLRLILLSILCKYEISDSVYMVFDILWETIPTLSLSLSLFTAILKFCEAIYNDDIKDVAYKMTLIAMAPIYSLFIDISVEQFSAYPQFQALYNATCRFYSVISSDIVTNPNYSMLQNFSMTPYCLLLLAVLPPDLPTTTFCLEKLEIIHNICPVHTIYFLIKRLNFIVDNKLQKFIQIYYQIMKKEIQRSSTASYNFLVIVFQMQVKCLQANEGCESLKVTNVNELNNDIEFTRIILRCDSIILPLLVMKPNQLHVLFERNACKPDKVLLSAISGCIINANSTYNERIYRIFLTIFGEEQPEVKNKESWIGRDFSKASPPYDISLDISHPTVNHPLSSILTQSDEQFENHEITSDKEPNESQNTAMLKESFLNFIRDYPLPKEHNEIGENITELIHSYRKYKPCKTMLSKLTKNLGNGISPFIATRPYVLRFTRSIGMNCKINDPQHPVCSTLAIRLGHIPPPQDPEDYQLAEIFIANFSPIDEILEETGSETLAGYFLNEVTPILVLKRFINTSQIQSVLMKAVSLVPIAHLKNPTFSISDINMEECFERIDINIPSASSYFYNMLDIIINNKCDPSLIKNFDTLFPQLIKKLSATSAVWAKISPLFPQYINITSNMKLKKSLQEILKILERLDSFPKSSI